MNGRDRRFYARAYSDPQLMRHIDSPLARRVALRSAAAALAGMRMHSLGARFWVIELQPSRVRIGLVGWKPVDEGLELGVILLPTWQGKGLAVQALRRLCEHALPLSATGRLLLRHRLGNVAAAAVCRELGFSVDEAMRDEHCHRVWTLTRVPD